MKTSIKHLASVFTLTLLLAPAHARAPADPAPAPLLTTVEQKLAEAPAGSRFGVLVTTLEGEILVSIAPDQRFIPASNTKMFTTAIGYAQLAALLFFASLFVPILRVALCVHLLDQRLGVLRSLALLLFDRDPSFYTRPFKLSHAFLKVYDGVQARNDQPRIDMRPQPRKAVLVVAQGVAHFLDISLGGHVVGDLIGALLQLVLGGQDPEAPVHFTRGIEQPREHDQHDHARRAQYSKKSLSQLRTHEQPHLFQE